MNDRAYSHATGTRAANDPPMPQPAPGAFGPGFKVWRHARGVTLIRTRWFQIRVTLWTGVKEYVE